MTQRRKKSSRVQSKQLHDTGNITHDDNDLPEDINSHHGSEENKRVKKRNATSTTNLFPIWIPWALVLVIMIIRIHYVLQRTNWWILHPDEVFEGVEVAHSLVHGYGFRMYDYLPPVVRNRTTAAEDQEHSLGIYSLRSFLYPYFYTPFLYLFKYSGITINSFLVCKVVHAIFSSLLPFAAYRFASAIFKNSDIGVMTSAFVAFSIHLNVLGTHCLVNSLLSPIFFLCLYEVLFIASKHSERADTQKTASSQLTITSPTVITMNYLTEWISYILNGFREVMSKDKPETTKDYVRLLRLFLASCILGLVIYIKIDCLLPLGILVVMEIVHYPKYVTDYKKYLTGYRYMKGGVLLAVFVGGYLDNVTYGKWLLSPIQWIKFSFIRDMSSKSFNKFGPLEYVDRINENRSCLWLNVFSAIVILLTLKQNHYKWSTVSIIVTVAGMLVVYSMQWHKEPRLIFNVYVFVCMLWAVAIQTVLEMFKFRKRKWLATTLISSVIVAYAWESYTDFPSSSMLSNNKWSNNNLLDSANINQCIEKTGQMSDVTGVLIDYTLYATGGFSLLNNNISLITKAQNEYYEYDLSDRPLYRSGLDPGIRAMNRMSDIIHILSTHYMQYTLSRKRHYNYIITLDPKSYLNYNFSEIFKCSKVTVLHRLSKLNQNDKSTEYVTGKTTASKNDTSIFSAMPDVLEYEGSWLLTIGHYQKSSERLHASLSHGSTRVRPYQLLGLCYYRSGNVSAVSQIKAECYDRYGKRKCDEPQPRLILQQYVNIIY